METNGNQLNNDKQNYLKLIEKSNDGIIVINKDGKAIFANKASLNLLNREYDEVIGSNIGYPLLKNETSELQIPQSDEKFKIVELRVIEMNWEGEDVYLCNFHDITHLKETENKLKEKEELLEQVGETARVGGWELDIKSKKLFGTNTTREILGIERNNIYFEEGLSFLTENSKIKLKRNIYKAIKDGISFDIELEIITSNNILVWVRVIGKPEMYGRKCIRIWGTFQDISDYKNRELVLTTAQDIAKIGYWVFDIKNNNLTWSEGVYKIWERDQETFKPTIEYFLDTIPGLDRKNISEAQIESLSPGEYYPFEHQIIAPSGKRKWILEKFTLHRDSNNNPSFIEGTTQDISDRKLVEEDLRKKTFDLNERLKEMNGLYRILALTANPELDLEYILQRSAEILASSWQYPNITCCKLTFDGQEFSTSNFRKTKWMQTVPIIIKDKVRGEIEVAYLEEKPEFDEGPFSKEERHLINTASDILSKYIDKLKTVEIIEFQSKIVNSIGEAVISTDLEGNIMYWNRAAEKIYGWSKDEVLGKNIVDITPSEDMLNAAKEIMNTLRKGKSWSGEFEVKNKHGKEFTVFLTDAPLFDENGEFIGIIGISRDISDLKEYRDSLKYRIEIENLVVKLSSNLVDVSIENFDEKLNSSLESLGKFTDVDRAYIFIFKNDMQEMDNTHEWVASGIKPEIDNLKDLPADAFPWWLKKLENYKNIHIKTLDELPKEAKVEKEILEQQDIKSVLVVPIYKSKELLGFLGFDSVKVEKEWSEFDIELLRTVGDIVANAIYSIKSQKELVRAKEKAEESDKLKSAFLANMSHEIRTPMNGILGFTQLLNDPNLDAEDMNDFVEQIQKSSKRMLNIINDLIDISKIEAGQMNTDLMEISVNQILDDIYEFFESSVKGENIELKYNKPLSDEKSVVKTDYTKVTQILTNLVNNAIKFTNEGSVEFGYTLKKNELEFYVKDTGIGISEEMQEAIFERFRQAELNLTRKYEGAGLGLSISKALVELLDGKMWVESKLEKGSTFYFTLPYESIEIDLQEDEVETIIEHENELDKNSKILIVEDDHTSYTLIKKIIDTENIESIHAENGEDAVKLALENNDLDLILMDIKLPIMNGYEATELIRKSKPNLPIIALTAFASEQDKQRALKTGCNDFLTKPVDIEKLKGLLGKYLKKDD